MKKSTIVIVLLIVLVLALGGYIAYDKIYLKENTETTNTSNKNENKEEEEEKEDEEISLDVNDRLVQELYSLVVDKENYYPHHYFNLDVDEELVSTMSEEKKMQLIYHNFSNFKYTSCQNINPQKIDNFTCSDTTRNTISKDEVERIYKKVFGKNAQLNTATEIKTSSLEMEKYVYNSNLNAYISYAIEGGGTGNSITTTTITRATKKDDELKIYEHVTIKVLDGTSEEHDYIYTFKLEDDEMYSFYSRVKEK